MLSNALFTSLFLFVALTSLAHAVLQPASDDLCFAATMRIAVANNALYFMGGKYTISGGISDGYSNVLFSIPLENNISTTSLLSSTDYFTATADGYTYHNQGAFFTDVDLTTLYSFAGFADPDWTGVDTILAYDVKSQQWSNQTVQGGAFNFASRAANIEATTENTNLGLSFFSGGWVDIPGMIRFDASDPKSLKWTNETNNNPPLTLEGSMEFIRYGKSGALITFGGYNKDYVDVAFKGWSYDHRNMAQIGLYDIESATWYNVTAEGDIPANRSAFCTAVSYAPDDSSIQITMYGGWDLFGGRRFADIYVLSIPSFHWIDVTDQSSVEFSLNPGGYSGRSDHKCKTLRDRTMLSVGGIISFGSVPQNEETCNTSWPVIRALDTSTYKWLDNFDPNAEAYYVPDQVTRIIGGSGDGGATLTAPVNGFTATAISEIFQHTVQRYTPSTTNTLAGSASTGTTTGSSATSTASSTASPPPESTSTNSSTPKSGTKSSSTGAIAGGVIGGLVFIAALAALFFFLGRRWSRKDGTTPRASQPPPPETYMSELPLTDEVYYPAGGAYYKPDANGSDASRHKYQHHQTSEIGSTMRVEADSYPVRDANEPWRSEMEG